MTIDKNALSHIAFDLDGTLIDSIGISEKIVQQIISQIAGIELSDEEARATNHKADVETWEKYGILDRADAIDELEKEILPEFASLQTFFDGAFDILSQLNEKGFVLASITNRSDNQLHSDPVLSQILDYFDLIVTCDTCGIGKPDTAPMKYFLKHFGIEPHNAVFIGDSNLDYKASLDSDIPFIHADLYDPSSDIPAKYRISSLNQLADLIL